MNGDARICDVCEDPYGYDSGCAHDGHQRCPACLHTCSECRDAINDYVRD